MQFQKWWKACWPLTLVISGGMAAASLPEQSPTPPADVRNRPSRGLGLGRGRGQAGPATQEAEEPVDLGLEPQERLLPDGSHTGSFVYVDAHGDLVRVKYVSGPAAGPRGFYVEERPVDEGGAKDDPLEPLASGMAPLLLPPPRARVGAEAGADPLEPLASGMAPLLLPPPRARAGAEAGADPLEPLASGMAPLLLPPPRARVGAEAGADPLEPLASGMAPLLLPPPRARAGAEAGAGAEADPLEPLASGMAPLLLPPPRSVRREPTPRPSDVFWQPKERADLTKAGLARLAPGPGPPLGPSRPGAQRRRRKSHG
ncbi:Protein transport protein SEC31 [Frankliniella fusca]|uniref:Protein transport protein SEC31 n=1 Tax=Frankliniella fusca TaxID=407009 RepID=A0AAE1LT32_9NEOP|nr:Protein transport protein SEC31 [Frankliniella fusca]